jgi:hypothetical protein
MQSLSIASRRMLPVVACMVVLGCGKGADKRDDPTPNAPLRVALGDCTTSDVPMISGPRPTRVDDSDTAAAEPRLPPAFDDSNIYGDLVGSNAKTGSTIGYYKPGPGVGGPRPRTQTGAVPATTMGQPNGQGSMDKAMIRRYIRRNIQKIQYCYEKELLARPAILGTITVHFFISPAGTVTTATADGFDPAVGSCVAGVIKDIEFPKPVGGGGIAVNYPFTFRPAGADTVPAQKPAGAGPLDGVDTVGAGSGSGSARDPHGAMPVQSTVYVPGATSPLAPARPAIEDCLRQFGPPSGAFVVGLAWGSGNESSLATDGVTPAKLATCLAAIKVTRPPGEPAAERCGVAFGVQPLTAVPTIAITADAITYNNNPVDHVKDVLAQTNDQISTLYESLDKWVKLTPATKTTVGIRGVGLIEPVAPTPMKIVNDVLRTVFAVGAEYVLAKQDGNTWQPLRPVVSPVAPVPIGTGTSWNGRFTTRARDPDPHGAPPDERVVLSIDVTHDSVWVGLSRVNEFQEVLDHERDKLTTVLKEHKASVFFADRTDIEIAGEDDATYGDVVRAIELAGQAGFVEWRVMDPKSLAARPAR